MRTSKQRKAALKHGYASGLEDKLAAVLTERGINFLYEKVKIEWEDLTYRTYTPDFILPNNIIVETKGRFVTADRLKHLKIRKQHPELDIRFVFDNSRQKLYKGSKTTYAMWCIKHDFRYYDKTIPDDWLKEPPLHELQDFISFPERKKE